MAGVSAPRLLMTSFAIICRRADPSVMTHLARQAEALAGAGHTVDIIAPSWPALANDLSNARVRVRSLGAAPGIGASLAAWLFWLRATIFITAAHVNRRYGGIQVVGTTGIFVITTWMAHLLGAKIILDTVDASPERVMAQTGLPRHSLRVRAAVVMEQLAIDYADHVITVSEPLRVRYISRGCPPEKITVIYRAPAEQRFGQVLNVARHPSIADRFLLVCAGHVGENFDYATPIRAIAAIRERLPQVLLWIACPAAQHARLEALIRSLDATQHILLQDALDEAALPPFIAQANANIVSTPRDPLSDLVLPMGVLESLGLGVPAISVRTQATQFYFDPRTLLVFDSEDVGDLAARIEWLSRHPETRARFMRQSREIAAQVQWSRERHRYTALLVAVADPHMVEERAPAEAAGLSKVSRRRSVPMQAYPAALAGATGGVMQDARILDEMPIEKIPTVSNIPLRLNAPSNQWRAGRQLRMRVGSWTLRGLAAALLFGLPVVASQPELPAKVLAAAMFVLLVFLMVLLPAGEAAIIVALFFVAQRAIFLHFPPEGFLGRVIVYLGTALQLIIFVGFAIRAIVQQRPLQRSGFILWPATLYVVVSAVSALINHVPLSVALLGTEHTLHNLVFVVLIAEDLPTPQQLRWYTGFVIAALCGLGLWTISRTAVAYHWLGLHLEHTAFAGFVPPYTPVSVIVSDPDSLAFLLSLGILLALALFATTNRARLGEEQGRTTQWLNIAMGAAVLELTIALFLTNSIENWLGLLIGAAVLFFILQGTRRYFIVGYLAVLLVLSFVGFPPAPGIAPVTYYSAVTALVQGQLPHNAPIATSLKVIGAHPILGVGPGRFGGTVAYITNSPVYKQYHVNLPRALTSIDLYWLHIWGETGIIGLGLMLWLIVQTERTILHAFRKGSHGRWNGITAGVFAIVIAFCLATFFDNALEVDALSAPFWALVGIAIALPIANRPPITESLPAVRFSADTEVEDDPNTSSHSNGSSGNGASSVIGGLEASPKGATS